MADCMRSRLKAFQIRIKRTQQMECFTYSLVIWDVIQWRDKRKKNKCSVKWMFCLTLSQRTNQIYLLPVEPPTDHLLTSWKTILDGRFSKSARLQTQHLSQPATLQAEIQPTPESDVKASEVVCRIYCHKLVQIKVTKTKQESVFQLQVFFS